MIKAIEYIAANGAQLRADKNMEQRNAWHLATIDGNGADLSTIGATSYGVAGKSYNGISVEDRDMTATLYADGFSAAGCQQMLSDVSKLVNAGSQSIGLVKLENADGERFQAPARITAVEIDEIKRASAKVKVSFNCPYNFFDDEVLHTVPLYQLTDGKKWALNRPYSFADIGTTSAGGTKTVHCINNGDVDAPVTLKIYGAGITKLVLRNTTTGAAITVTPTTAATGIVISTDINDLYARFANGSDASRYVSLYSDISSFNLRPGDNTITAVITATSITQAASCLEYRGRYSTCL